MDKNMFMRGLLLCLVYSVFYYIDKKFITKDEFILKKLVKNMLIVYISFISSVFIYQQIEPIKSGSVMKVFTEAPNF
tara:strand:- start:1444 stop:1674 length:231 start_codon:yes stop_codon:yes gene_type:complete